jgi:hypothetical protein
MASFLMGAVNNYSFLLSYLEPLRNFFRLTQSCNQDTGPGSGDDSEDHLNQYKIIYSKANEAIASLPLR